MFEFKEGQILTMKRMNPKLQILIPVVKGLAKILGKDYEVNLHDLSMPENSMVLCEHGHVTGRKPGGPMTDFGLFMMQSEDYRTKDGVFNYLACNNKGGLIRCSAIFIRDENNEMIAFLCINYDMSKAMAVQKLLEDLLYINPEPVKQYEPEATCSEDQIGNQVEEDLPSQVKEWFAQDLEEAVSDTLAQIKHRLDKPLHYLSKTEKKEIVLELSEKGFFLLKGSVETLAAEMGNTKYTIYSYIREIQKRKI